jgi:undecaprenyl-diphosphatase
MGPQGGVAVAASSLPPGLSDFRLPLDEPLFRLLNGLSSPPIDALATWLSRPLFDWCCAALVLLWVLFRLRRRAVVPVSAALVAVGVSDLIGARVLKPWFHRMRPFDALPPGSVHQALHASHLGSMPSLHAANAFALAVVLSRAVPKLAPMLYGFATLIALSRVVGGVHWPSDILAGALFGAAIGLCVIWCAERAGAETHHLHPPERFD